MGYKFTTGSVSRGDIYFEDDRDSDATYINFEQNAVSFVAGGTSQLNVSASAVGVGTVAPVSALDVHHNPTAYSNDTGGGEVVLFGAGPSGGSTTAGKLYYLDDAGQWELAQANSLTTCGTLLAIALGTTPGTHGMLIRGFFDMHSNFTGTFNEGMPVYVDDANAGKVTMTAPDTSGDIIRIVGYCTTTSNVIYFNPSMNTLELS